MLAKSSTTTDSNPSTDPLSVFDRAKARLGIRNKGSAADKPSAALASAPSSILEKFYSLKGGEKTAFFRSHKAELMAAEAADLRSTTQPSKTVATSRGAQSSVEQQFHSGSAVERSAFFWRVERLLLASEGQKGLRTPDLSRSLPQSSGNSDTSSKISDSQGAASALLEKFEAMKGAEKTAFFRANRPLLKAAADVVVVEETTKAHQIKAGTSGDLARRNFSTAQAAAPHRPAGADLLETFHTLNGTAKTAFFRANHLALKIAAANETR